jgi:16S rRNA (uracil1498-N3)-methyltransferase
MALTSQKRTSTDQSIPVCFMRISRIYIDMPLQAGSELSLPADAAHHLAVVLRVKTDQPVILFNNTGTEAQAIIVRSR